MAGPTLLTGDMDTLTHILNGFEVALQPLNLLFLTIGVVLGTVIGMLPGIGSVAGIALLLPLTFGMDPVPSLIMLAGIYYGSAYGNTVSAVLLNTPGTGDAVMTTFDGYPMAQSGRAGPALAIAAVASFLSGTIGIVALTLFAIPFSSFALRFGPAENFMLFLFAMTAVGALTGSNIARGILAALVGLVIASVGIDLQSGYERFTFGIVGLQEGIPFIAVIVGFFAITEIFRQIERWHRGELKPIRIEGRLWFTREDWRRAYPAIGRGGVIGFITGVLPGAGGVIATVIAYGTEKRLSREPERFGKGAIEGVAAPEAANNGATAGAFVPLLTLGIPGSASTAVLLGAFIMWGIQPGPQLFETRPDLVWGLIDSMYLGNLLLLVINIPLIGLFARILYLPPGLLISIILGIALTGVYSVNGSSTDVLIALVFGLIGYGFRRVGLPVAPLILGVVLGEAMEQSFRQALTISQGDPTIFLSSAVCVGLAVLSALSMSAPLIRRVWQRRRVHRT